jgi:hypothetical protein
MVMMIAKMPPEKRLSRSAVGFRSTIGLLRIFQKCPCGKKDKRRRETASAAK